MRTGTQSEQEYEVGEADELYAERQTARFWDEIVGAEGDEEPGVAIALFGLVEEDRVRRVVQSPTARAARTAMATNAPIWTVSAAILVSIAHLDHLLTPSQLFFTLLPLPAPHADLPLALVLAAPQRPSHVVRIKTPFIPPEPNAIPRLPRYVRDCPDCRERDPTSRLPFRGRKIFRCEEDVMQYRLRRSKYAWRNDLTGSDFHLPAFP